MERYTVRACWLPDCTDPGTLRSSETPSSSFSLFLLLGGELFLQRNCHQSLKFTVVGGFFLVNLLQTYITPCCLLYVTRSSGWRRWIALVTGSFGRVPWVFVNRARVLKDRNGWSGVRGFCGA